MAEDRKKKRKIYFTIGGQGLKSGLDLAIKVGITKFNKRTAHKMSFSSNLVFNELTRNLGQKKLNTKD